MVEFLAYIFQLNAPISTYIEPFAGGAGAALGLLFKGHVKRIVLNDADFFIFQFWNCVLNHTEELLEAIQSTEVSMEEWHRRRGILLNEEQHANLSPVEVGFTAFFLNRTNRSGIIRGGPIGGLDQTGKWKIDARYNITNLTERIRRVSRWRNRIDFFNLDAIDFLRKSEGELGIDSEECLVYLDPPYFRQGPELYRKFYSQENHVELKDFLQDELNHKWILSYDDEDYIRELYMGIRTNGVKVNHFANKAKIGKELIIISNNCVNPYGIEKQSKRE